MVLVIALAIVAVPHAAWSQANQARATFAGGCFWCMEPPYDKLDGVFSTTSGYTGGHVEDPTYKEVSAGGTGHAEVVQVVYDPSKVTYEQLLRIFWRNVDPFDGDGQFCDRGSQYRPAIFYHSEAQQEAAVASKERMSERFDQSIEVEIQPLSEFYPAEDYHQNYYKKNPLRYRFYRSSCGRDRRLEAVWGDEAGG
jgi:peptide-methionine (S)-S-oxide reductase